MADALKADLKNSLFTIRDNEPVNTPKEQGSESSNDVSRSSDESLNDAIQVVVRSVDEASTQQINNDREAFREGADNV
jgi:hypothetical protein